MNLFLSCATSMTPMEVNKILPTLTNSKQLSQNEVNNVKNSNCKFLVKARNYIAPIGFTAKDDLKNAAKGIDDWVKIDGGNAFVLLNYKWVHVDDNGGTQLQVDFDTVYCD